ncbi:MAG: thioredoxin [Clostridiales bacterium]|jgi:hypothetical protein|nr:thioredoxin [Clostridiales bacterium]
MKGRLWITFAVAFFSVCLMVMGVIRGEVGIVFKKAINVCLECIGIG